MRSLNLRWLLCLVCLLSILAVGICAAQDASASPPQDPATPSAPPATPDAPSTLPAAEIAPVQQIEFVGNTVFSSDELRKVAGVLTDVPLAPNILPDAVSRIQAAYTERGYIADFVYYEIQGEHPPRTLTFHIREVHVESIKITGLKVTHEETVREFIPIHEGDLYNQRLVREAVTRLTNLNIFSSIDVFLREGTKPGYVVLDFVVKESKVQRVDLSGSYDPSGRVVLIVGYTNANFLGRAEQLGATLSIGSVAGQVGGSVTYFSPAAPTPDTTVAVSGFSLVDYRFTNDLITTPSSGRYFERQTGLRYAKNRLLTPTKQLTYAFRFNDVSTVNFPTNFVPSNTPSTNGWVAVPSARYIQDDRIALVFPVAGTYSMTMLEAGYSGPQTGPSSAIARLQGDGRWLFPLRRITADMLTAENPRPVKAFAVRLSGGAAGGTLPFSEQFFLGGVDTLRGYTQDRFWGNYFLLLNNEFRFPITNRIVGLVFVDAGDAWGSAFQIAPGVVSSYRQTTGFHLQADVGVGAWYVSPLGFWRLSYAKGTDWQLGFAVGQPF